MNTTDAIELIIRQQEDILTETERQQLDAWRALSTTNQQVYDNIRQLYRADWSWVEHSPGAEFFMQQSQVIRQKMLAVDQRQHRTRLRLKIAAVLVLALVAAVFISIILPDADRVHLTFVQTDVETIADALEEEYDVHIEVEEAAKHLRFTGDFVHQDLEVVLTVLANSMPLTVQHRGNTYILVSRQAL